jgi:four helix bundle protein
VEAVMARVYRFDFKRLDVYQAALLHFGWCMEVAGRVPRDGKVLVWQMLRAALSLILNIGEAGGRRRPGESAQYLRVAQGSAHECAALLDALAVAGVIDDDAYNAQEQLLARIGAMLTAMIRTKVAAIADPPPNSKSNSMSNSKSMSKSNSKSKSMSNSKSKWTSMSKSMSPPTDPE